MRLSTYSRHGAAARGALLLLGIGIIANSYRLGVAYARERLHDHGHQWLQRRHMVTYGDKRFLKSKQRLVQEANETGWFDTVHAFGPNDLPVDFKDQFRGILLQKRGGGYWIWKIPVLEMALNRINEGDILLYADAGFSINPHGKHRFLQQVQALQKSKGGFLSFDSGFKEHIYTTAHIFRAFNATGDERIRQSNQLAGGLLYLRKGPHVRRWLKLIKGVLRMDPWLISDKYNAAARLEDPELRDNRHDQSVMSVARKIVGEGPVMALVDTLSTVNPKVRERFTSLPWKERLRLMPRLAEEPFWASRLRDW